LRNLRLFFGLGIAFIGAALFVLAVVFRRADPPDPFRLEAEALALRDAGDTAGAERLLLSAVEAGGGFSARHRLALLRLEAGLADPALFEAALAEAPPEVDCALYERAIRWLGEGRRDLALAGLREATKGLDFSP
jgi:hypothetical protein